jgi:hypothetical protein
MLTVLPDPCPARQERYPAGSGPGGGLPGGGLPGGPWSVRLAGARSACPALELYEAGALIDVITATRMAPQLLRGARAAARGPGQRALAWGRRPGPGVDVVVEFSRGRLRRDVRPATVVMLTPWCWLAVADGRFTRVEVQAGLRRARLGLARGRSWR